MANNKIIKMSYMWRGVNSPILVVDKDLYTDVIWVDPYGIYSHRGLATEEWGVEELHRCCGIVTVKIPDNIWYERLDGAHEGWFFKKNKRDGVVYMYNRSGDVYKVTRYEGYNPEFYIEKMTLNNYLLEGETEKIENFEVEFRYGEESFFTITAPKVSGINQLIKSYLNYRYGLERSRGHAIKIDGKIILIDDFKNGEVAAVLETDCGSRDFEDFLETEFNAVITNEVVLKFLKEKLGIEIYKDAEAKIIFYKNLAAEVGSEEVTIIEYANYAYKIKPIKEAIIKKIKEKIKKA